MTIRLRLIGSIAILTAAMCFLQGYFCPDAEAYRGYKVYAKISEDMPEVFVGLDGFNRYPSVEIPDEFYNKYLQPNLGFPYNITWEERQKLDADEIMKRYQEGINAHANIKASADKPGDYFYPFVGIGIRDSNGYIRYKSGREWRRSYFDEDGNAYKFIAILDYPEDSRGIGILTHGYVDPERGQDNWLYLPGVRRVRRLSQSNMQDNYLGSVTNNEDWLMSRADYTYKLARSEVFKGLEKDNFFWHPTMATSRLNGVGQECWVIEWTPTRSWFWAKQVSWIEKKSFFSVWQEKYDKNGNLIKRFCPGYKSLYDNQKLAGFTIVGKAKIEDSAYSCSSGAEDMRTGDRTWFQTDECVIRSGFPEEILTTRTLQQMPGRLPERPEWTGDDSMIIKLESMTR